MHGERGGKLIVVFMIRGVNGATRRRAMTMTMTTRCGVVMTITDNERSPSPGRSCVEAIVSCSREFECEGRQRCVVIAVEYFLF